MANEIDLSELHESIGQALADAFPGVTVSAYGRPGEKMPVPAITFELDSIEPAEEPDMGTEQLEVRLRFSAYVIHSYKQGNKLAVRLMAGNLAHFIRGKKWGEAVTPALFIASLPDTFDAENPEYEVWRVEWEHTACLGESVWDEAGTLPTKVFISTVPFIGIPNEPYYVQVFPEKVSLGNWTPSNLSLASRTIWLDASDPSTISESSGVVTSWTDKWAGGFEFKTDTTSEKPTTGAALINGLNTITFDATNKVLYSRKNGVIRSLTDLNKDAPYSAWAGFFVVRSRSLKNCNWYFEVNSNNYIGVVHSGDSSFYFDAGFKPGGELNRAFYFPFSNTYPTTSLVGLTASTAGTTKLFFNGDLKNQINSPFNITAGLWTRIGGNGTPTGGSDSDWGEVIILKQVPDDPTRQVIEGYLAHKWGLVGSLAASHPYKFAPPSI